MTIDPASGVRILGEGVPYSDGSEEELFAIVDKASDRSSSSDELAEAIRDWPTRYHLSRQRSNLLRALDIRPGMRVLDLGAGTGPMSRYLGEQGATVVALEGSFDRAKVAAARCHDLPNVEVCCGTIEDYEADTPFDVVTLVGVLEYSGHDVGGAQGPGKLLAEVRRVLAPDGVVVVAIENQLGLKYLLGYAEDHVGLPWAGVEAYATVEGIRTWARAPLSALLAEAGLTSQRWLYPYPDYKLPSAVLTDAAFRQPDAAQFVDQLVGDPCKDYANPPARLCDERLAHRTFVAAGLGPEVANSFLVVACAGPTPSPLVDDATVAWHFGGARRRMWLRAKVIRQEADGLVVDTRPVADVPDRADGWLRQRQIAERPYVAGQTLEQQAFDACAAHDLAALGSVLRRWREYLEARAVPYERGVGAHPFLTVETTRVLPPALFDVDLGNFVDARDGLTYIDAEWEASGGVDADLAMTRALWFFAETLVTTGAEHPWAVSATVDDLATGLAELGGVPVSPAQLERWRDAELDVQQRVVGVDPAELAGHWETVAARSGADVEDLRGVPFARLRRELERLERELASLRAKSAAELEAAQRRIRETEAEIERWQDRWAAIERRFPVKLARAVRRLVGWGPS